MAPPVDRTHFTAALIGTNHPHSPYLLRTLHNLPEIKRVHLWTEDAGFDQRSAGENYSKIDIVTSELKLLLSGDGIDFAIICVPTDQVAAITSQTLRARIPVLIDKPAGMNASEIMQLAALARAMQVKAAVYYGQRAHPAVADTRRLIQEGAIGRLLAVDARIVTTQVRYRDPRHWLFQKARSGGGILTWLGTHYLDLVPHLVNDQVVQVSAQFATVSGEAIDVEDFAALTLRFKAGAIATLQLGYLLANRGQGYGNSSGFESSITCHGQHGRILWRGVTSRSLHVDAPRPAAFASVANSRIRYRLPRTTSYGGAVGERFFRQFLQALRGDGTTPASLDDALRAMQLVEAAQKSASCQRSVSVQTIPHQ